MKTKIIISDSETTGLVEPIYPIEIAHLEIDYPSLEVISGFEQKFFPPKPIEFGALMTSHILMSELVGSQPSIQGQQEYKEFIEDNVAYMIGQYIQYDWNVYGQPDVKQICTKALATWLLPDYTDSFSQSALLYFFMGDAAKPLLKEAHTAMADVENNLRLLSYLMPLIEAKIGYTPDIQKLYELSEEAKVPTKMTFGKHKGKTYVEVARIDSGYYTWWQTKSDTKPDAYQQIAIDLALATK